MIESHDNNLLNVSRELSKSEVMKGTVVSGIIGLGLSILGLAAIVSIGTFGTWSGPGISGVVIGLGCIVLMLPSALLLGTGILFLRLSIAGLYALIVGKPVYVFSHFRRNCPDSM